MDGGSDSDISYSSLDIGASLPLFVFCSLQRMFGHSVVVQCSCTATSLRYECVPFDLVPYRGFVAGVHVGVPVTRNHIVDRGIPLISEHRFPFYHRFSLKNVHINTDD
jgi:hypothetical protein